MSNRGKALQLFDRLPDSKIMYLIGYMQGLTSDHIMNDKRRIMELLDTIPEYKMPYVLAYIQGMASTDEEKPTTLEG